LGGGGGKTGGQRPRLELIGALNVTHCRPATKRVIKKKERQADHGKSVSANIGGECMKETSQTGSRNKPSQTIYQLRGPVILRQGMEALKGGEGRLDEKREKDKG